MSERTLMDSRITFQRENTCCIRVMESIALEIGVENLDGSIWHGNDARHLSVSLSSAPIKREDTVVHLEDSALDHDDAVHLIFHIEFSNAVLTAILVKLNTLLVSLHVQLFIWASQHHFEVVYRAHFFRPYVNDEARLTFLSDGHIQGFLYWLKNEARFSAKSSEFQKALT